MALGGGLPGTIKKFLPQNPANSKDLLKYGLIFIALIGIAVVSMALWFSGMSNSSSDPRKIDAGPTSSAQPMLRKLMLYAKPDQFVKANVSDLQAIKKEITDLQQKITANDPTIKIVNGVRKEDAQALLATMVNEIDGIISNQNDSKKVLELGKSFIDHRKKIETMIRMSGFLNVPKVTQGRDQLCGRTSAMMVLLYYSGNEIKDYMTQHIRIQSNGTPATTGTGSSPLSPAMLNAHTGKSGWTYAGSLGKGKDYVYNILKKSIDGGDPVILYTYGAMYRPTSNHIVVVVGYDERDKSLIINNPATLKNGDTEVATKKPNRGRSLMSIDNIYDHLGEKFSGYSGHSFLIRQEYL